MTPPDPRAFDSGRSAVSWLLHGDEGPPPPSSPPAAPASERTPRKGKPELTVRWSRAERALLYDGNSPTGGFLSGIFERITIGEMNGHLCGLECNRNGLTAKLNAGRVNPSDGRTLAQELDARGYDLTTLRFSIRKKPAPSGTP